MSVKEIAGIISPLLKRNFLEWRRLKKEVLSKSKIKCVNNDEEKIKKIMASEPLAVFYANWLKLPNSKENLEKLNEKIIGYITGLFSKELDRKASEKIALKCKFISGIYRDIAPKTIKSVLAMTKIYSDEKSFKEIFENEAAYKAIIKSSMDLADWRLHTAILLGSVMLFEIAPENAGKAHCFSSEIILKREKEIFS